MKAEGYVLTYIKPGMLIRALTIKEHPYYVDVFLDEPILSVGSETHITLVDDMIQVIQKLKSHKYIVFNRRIDIIKGLQ